MKKLLGCICFSIILFSCRRERINPDEIRMLKTTVGGPNGSKINTHFEYDNQGRIVRITRDIDNSNQKLIATISYNGNEATIVDTSKNEFDRTIKFVLNAENKPLQRIQIEKWHFLAIDFEQKNFINDTTHYEYNSTGLLTRTRIINRDSVWSFHNANPSASNQISSSSITRTFQSSNGNVISMSGAGTRFYRIINGNGTFIRNYVVEESISFDYTSGFKNQIDFKNAFILAEYGGHHLGVVTSTAPNIPIFSFLNPGAKNVPNKSVMVIQETDNFGVQVERNSSTLDYKFFYNKYGFVSGIAGQNGINPDITFTYNR